MPLIDTFKSTIEYVLKRKVLRYLRPLLKRQPTELEIQVMAGHIADHLRLCGHGRQKPEEEHPIIKAEPARKWMPD